MSAVSRGVLLYREILKSHRRSLPAPLKKLGDEYVRAEFRLHKKVEKPEVLQRFFREWEQYLVTVKAQKGRFGKDLEQSNLESMTEAQKTKLAELKQAAKESIKNE